MSDQTTIGLSANLAGQVALVTGASRGLGKAIAIELARNGARVACVARDTENWRRRLRQSVRQAVGPRRSRAMSKNGSRLIRWWTAFADNGGGWIF